MSDNAYTDFANIYDDMMENIPYADWVEKLHKLFAERGVKGVCELACGTGVILEGLSEHGYDLVGIDISESMLSVATERLSDAIMEGKCVVSLQDMRRFALPSPSDAVICLCDSVNYLSKSEYLLDMFRSVRENMKDGGIFIFDVKTEHCFRDVMGDEVRVDEGEEGDYLCIWDNNYDEGAKCNEYLLTIFERCVDDIYRRTDELHTQYVHDHTEIIEAMEDAGFKNIGWGCDIDDILVREKQDVDNMLERIYYYGEK